MRRRSFEALVGQLDQLSPQQRVSLLQAVRRAAERVGVHENTSLRWRHRMLSLVRTDRQLPLRGIVEADEMYLLESEKGACQRTRPARKRGGVASKRGISSEQVCVLVARDRSGNPRRPHRQGAAHRGATTARNIAAFRKLYGAIVNEGEQRNPEAVKPAGKHGRIHQRSHRPFTNHLGGRARAKGQAENLWMLSHSHRRRKFVRHPLLRIRSRDGMISLVHPQITHFRLEPVKAFRTLVHHHRLGLEVIVEGFLSTFTTDT